MRLCDCADGRYPEVGGIIWSEGNFFEPRGAFRLAFGAGLVAVLNPCGFAMLPVYMTLVVRGDATGQLSALRRAVVATIEMVLGFMTVFGAFGLLTVSAASAVQQHLPYVTVLIGIVLVGLGMWSLAGDTKVRRVLKLHSGELSASSL